ncbi:MAG: hypothetical protein KDD82_22085 [Planctomycetes bacterium]|nr:hypothetical protein [Planctomycetota bacterium]
MSWTLPALAGFGAGVGLGGFHMATLYLAVRRSLRQGSQGALFLTAPLRVIVPALGLLLAVRLGGPPALAAAFVGYLLTVQLARRRALPAPEEAS